MGRALGSLSCFGYTAAVLESGDARGLRVSEPTTDGATQRTGDGGAEASSRNLDGRLGQRRGFSHSVVLATWFREATIQVVIGSTTKLVSCPGD
jgi:hypothetical protein